MRREETPNRPHQQRGTGERLRHAPRRPPFRRAQPSDASRAGLLAPRREGPRAAYARKAEGLGGRERRAPAGGRVLPRACAPRAFSLTFPARRVLSPPGARRLPPSRRVCLGLSEPHAQWSSRHCRRLGPSVPRPRPPPFLRHSFSLSRPSLSHGPRREPGYEAGRREKGVGKMEVPRLDHALSSPTSPCEEVIKNLSLEAIQLCDRDGKSGRDGEEGGSSPRPGTAAALAQPPLPARAAGSFVVPPVQMNVGGGSPSSTPPAPQTPKTKAPRGSRFGGESRRRPRPRRPSPASPAWPRPRAALARAPFPPAAPARDAALLIFAAVPQSWVSRRRRGDALRGFQPARPAASPRTHTS